MKNNLISNLSNPFNKFGLPIKLSCIAIAVVLSGCGGGGGSSSSSNDTPVTAVLAASNSNNYSCQAAENGDSSCSDSVTIANNAGNTITGVGTSVSSSAIIQQAYFDALPEGCSAIFNTDTTNSCLQSDGSYKALATGEQCQLAFSVSCHSPVHLDTHLTIKYQHSNTDFSLSAPVSQTFLASDNFTYSVEQTPLEIILGADSSIVLTNKSDQTLRHLKLVLPAALSGVSTDTHLHIDALAPGQSATLAFHLPDDVTKETITNALNQFYVVADNLKRTMIQNIDINSGLEIESAPTAELNSTQTLYPVTLKNNTNQDYNHVSIALLDSQGHVIQQGISVDQSQLSVLANSTKTLYIKLDSNVAERVVKVRVDYQTHSGNQTKALDCQLDIDALIKAQSLSVNSHVLSYVDHLAKTLTITNNGEFDWYPSTNASDYEVADEGIAVSASSTGQSCLSGEVVKPGSSCTLNVSYTKDIAQNVPDSAAINIPLGANATQDGVKTVSLSLIDQKVSLSPEYQLIPYVLNTTDGQAIYRLLLSNDDQDTMTNIKVHLPQGYKSVNDPLAGANACQDGMSLARGASCVLSVGLVNPADLGALAQGKISIDADINAQAHQNIAQLDLAALNVIAAASNNASAVLSSVSLSEATSSSMNNERIQIALKNNSDQDIVNLALHLPQDLRDLLTSESQSSLMIPVLKQGQSYIFTLSFNSSVAAESYIDAHYDALLTNQVTHDLSLTAANMLAFYPSFAVTKYTLEADNQTLTATDSQSISLHNPTTSPVVVTALTLGHGITGVIFDPELHLPLTINANSTVHIPLEVSSSAEGSATYQVDYSLNNQNKSLQKQISVANQITSNDLNIVPNFLSQMQKPLTEGNTLQKTLTITNNGQFDWHASDDSVDYKIIDLANNELAQGVTLAPAQSSCLSAGSIAPGQSCTLVLDLSHTAPDQIALEIAAKNNLADAKNVIYTTTTTNNYSFDPVDARFVPSKVKSSIVGADENPVYVSYQLTNHATHAITLDSIPSFSLEGLSTISLANEAEISSCVDGMTLQSGEHCTIRQKLMFNSEGALTEAVNGFINVHATVDGQNIQLLHQALTVGGDSGVDYISPQLSDLTLTAGKINTLEITNPSQYESLSGVRLHIPQILTGDSDSLVINTLAPSQSYQFSFTPAMDQSVSDWLNANKDSLLDNTQSCLIYATASNGNKVCPSVDVKAPFDLADSSIDVESPGDHFYQFEYSGSSQTQLESISLIAGDSVGLSLVSDDTTYPLTLHYGDSKGITLHADPESYVVNGGIQPKLEVSLSGGIKYDIPITIADNEAHLIKSNAYLLAPNPGATTEVNITIENEGGFNWQIPSEAALTSGISVYNQAGQLINSGFAITGSTINSCSALSSLAAGESCNLTVQANDTVAAGDYILKTSPDLRLTIDGGQLNLHVVNDIGFESYVDNSQVALNTQAITLSNYDTVAHEVSITMPQDQNAYQVLTKDSNSPWCTPLTCPEQCEVDDGKVLMPAAINDGGNVTPSQCKVYVHKVSDKTLTVDHIAFNASDLVHNYTLKPQQNIFLMKGNRVYHNLLDKSYGFLFDTNAWQLMKAGSFSTVRFGDAVKDDKGNIYMDGRYTSLYQMTNQGMELVAKSTKKMAITSLQFDKGYLYTTIDNSGTIYRIPADEIGTPGAPSSPTWQTYYAAKHEGFNYIGELNSLPFTLKDDNQNTPTLLMVSVVGVLGNVSLFSNNQWNHLASISNSEGSSQYEQIFTLAVNPRLQLTPVPHYEILFGTHPAGSSFAGGNSNMKRVYKAALGCGENGTLSVITGNDQCQASDMVLINPSSLSGELTEGYQLISQPVNPYYGVLNLQIVYNPVNLIDQYIYMLGQREATWSTISDGVNEMYMMNDEANAPWQAENPIPMLGSTPQFEDIDVVNGMQIKKQ
ncbi:MULTISPECIES: hypothetical protein [Cysteiniphilum]|uniref:Uncharacterized protein n=1 Tax=Cysteiniphilum litorale TaxID=2056700 RepID=A0A8J3E9U1_9GAMM|nr:MULTISPECIES: hypothetical protein [Cysteiniphilum]GGG06176.1 hypothetical protein GCM10010995_24570 [Cysteiniphilum litorale]